MENKKNKNNDFSVKKGNLEVVSKEEDAEKIPTGGSVSISRDGLDVKKGGNIIIGSLNIVANPIKKRHEKYYKTSKFHLIADLVLVFAIISLLVAFFVFRNLEPELDVSVEANTTNKIITSGRVETFEIEYENNLGKNSLIIDDFPYISTSNFQENLEDEYIIYEIPN